MTKIELNGRVYGEDEKGKFEAVLIDPDTFIARPGTSCGNSHFGNIDHIKRLMQQGYFHDTLTAYGQELMNTERR